MKFAIMCGLPGSGKSTFCNEWFGEYITVCPDKIRLALHGQQYVKELEPQIWKIVEYTVRVLLESGNSVVIDATNVHEWGRKKWIDMADKFGIPLNIFVMDTSKEICIERDKQRKASVGVEVISRMAKDFVMPSKSEGNVFIWVVNPDTREMEELL